MRKHLSRAERAEKYADEALKYGLMESVRKALAHAFIAGYDARTREVLNAKRGSQKKEKVKS